MATALAQKFVAESTCRDCRKDYRWYSVAMKMKTVASQIDCPAKKRKIGLAYNSLGARHQDLDSTIHSVGLTGTSDPASNIVAKVR